MPNNRCRNDDPLDGLTFQFQPILAEDGERVLTYEMLARRSARDGTIQGPGAFIDAAMEPDRIEQFTLSSLESALEVLAANPQLPGLSVNLSPRQIELTVTGAVISRAPLSSRRRLYLELTEDSIVEHPALSGVLRGLASLGTRIFLDDIDERWQQRCMVLGDAVHGLKVDRSLLNTLAAGSMPSNSRALVEYANQSGLVLVAEGIEDAELLPILAARGVEYFQGFALGEPWSEPKVARRRILPPGNTVVGRSLAGAVSVLSGGKGF